MKVNFFTYSYRPNTSFSSREHVRAKADAFSDELLQEASSGYLPLEKVQEITQRHVPELKIKPLSIKSRKYKNNGGMYHSYFKFHTTPPRAEISQKVLDLKIVPPDIGRKKFNEYLCTIAHEMTHAFQACDKDTRDDKLVNEALAGIPIEKWWDIMDVAYQEFCRLENEVLKPTILAHKDILDFNGTTPYLTQVDHFKLKEIIAKRMSQIKEQHPDINMDFIKKMFYLQAMDEFDAYMTDEKLKEKIYANQKYEKDDFIPYLYLCLADCLDVKGVE